MKKAITTGIMVLFFVLAVTIVPLTAKAEMQAMTENEMEMVTGQRIFFSTGFQGGFNGDFFVQLNLLGLWTAFQSSLNVTNVGFQLAIGSGAPPTP